MKENLNTKDKSNQNDLTKIMLIYLLIYVTKIFIIYRLRKFKKSSENLNNSEENKSTPKSEIDRLKKEAEVYNNPQNYVKYVKLERQILKLQKELESKSITDDKVDINTNSYMTSFEIPIHTYIKIVVEIIFYFSHLVSIYLLHGKYLIVEKNSFPGQNTIFNFYATDGDSHLIKIPLYFILILEGIFLHKLEEIITKIKN